MPKIQQKAQMSEQERKTLLEAELKDYHNEQKNARHFSGRKLPHFTEGLDRQELYDTYGHC